jgi:hypothetical protein
MASTKKLVSRMLNPAPSAPSAPSVRNAQGQRAGAGSQSAFAAGNIAPGSGGVRPGQGGVKGPNAGKRVPSVGHLGARLYNPEPVKATPGTYKPGHEIVPPKPPAGPGTDPSAMITDPIYWQSRMALGQEYAVQTAGNLVEQTLADNEYQAESERQLKDYDRGRRNLAEALMGRGSSIYGGMHLRDRTEGEIDFGDNKARLDKDYKAANYGRTAELTDINARLNPETGTEYTILADEWRARQDAAGADTAETAAPDYGMGKKAQRKNLQRQIANMRKRHDKIDDPKQRKKIRAKIAEKRKRLRKLNS